MTIRWNVLCQGGRYSVLREGRAHGSHEARQRAVDAALFMARIEADKQGHVGEVFVEDGNGHVVQQLTISPRETSELQVEHGQTIRRVGLDRVLVSV